MPRRVFRSDPVCHFLPVSKAESKSLILFPNLPASRLASRLSMEESSSSSSSSSSSTTPLHPLSYWDCLNLFLLRPSLAISFVFSFILLGWFLAWKLVLVHVPLVQEIFGLRKKSVKPKPPNRHRLSKFYSGMNRDTQQHSNSNKPI